jgi:hypothetical protein
MTKLKKLVIAGVTVALIGVTSVTALAASGFSSRADALSELTGRTSAEIREQKQAGKSLGEIAAEAGVREEFRAADLEIKKDILAQRVADGEMTQEEADRILEAIEDRQANCDGTGSNGLKLGAGFGERNRDGEGNGERKGAGEGHGEGRGLRNGGGLGNGNGRR